jgi:class I fructose-bisphosphate aldolase
MRQLVDDHGKSMILPYDQFVEDDCRHLDCESDGGNPHAILDLARDGRYTGVVIHHGVARRYWSRLEGAVPLILKLNASTATPPPDGFPAPDRVLSPKGAFGALTASVEDAVRRGAAAAGYTMDHGSPRQADDLTQLAGVRRECERLGMPLVVWASPRREGIARKGVDETSYALESAARLAMEMGATAIASSIPKAAAAGFFDLISVPVYYRNLERELQGLPEAEALQIRADRIVSAVQGAPVLFTSGSDVDDEDLLYHAEVCVKAGCLGLLFGREIWKRERGRALEISEKLRSLLHEAD